MLIPPIASAATPSMNQSSALMLGFKRSPILASMLDASISRAEDLGGNFERISRSLPIAVRLMCCPVMSGMIPTTATTIGTTIVSMCGAYR